jgi:hypothetical protein
MSSRGNSACRSASSRCGIGGDERARMVAEGRDVSESSDDREPGRAASRWSQWMSKGAAYQGFIARMKSLGPRGFRAVLWHQGESDANQKDHDPHPAGKSLPRSISRTILRESRREIGWRFPGLSHRRVITCPAMKAVTTSAPRRLRLGSDGIAFAGPDSDALERQTARARAGKGVHFSGKGLRVHGRNGPRSNAALDRQRNGPSLEKTNGGTEWSRLRAAPREPQRSVG